MAKSVSILYLKRDGETEESRYIEVDVSMKRCHVAIFTLLANGHVYPILPLCSELVKRGYRVTCATNDHYAPKIFETGSEPVLFYSKPMSREAKEELDLRLTLPVDDPRQWESNVSWAEYFDDISDTFLQLQAFYQANTPDLVLYDRYLPVGRIMAQRFHSPTVQISPHFAYLNNFTIRENGVCRTPAPVLEDAKVLDSFLSEFGITTKDNLWHTEKLNIHFIPKTFQYDGSFFDERFCFVGALLNRSFEKNWIDASNGKRIILVSGLSGMHGWGLDLDSYFQTFVDALADSEFYCILSVGDSFTGRSIGALPANFEINRCTSHLEILPHVSLSTSHGGMLSTLEAVYSGVPTLLIPTHPECAEIAYRVAELGLGTHLPRSAVTVEKIRDSVRTMLGDTALMDRVKNMGLEFKGSGGAAMAVDRIERFLNEA